MATANASGKGIVLSRLSKSYGRVRAVRSVDLEIAAGETVALLGPNGAGKTTTIDMVLGLSRPDSGSISLFGMSPPAAVAAAVIGGMLQTGSLIEYLSVRELLTMVASLYPRPLEVDRVRRLTGAAEFASRRRSSRTAGMGRRPATPSAMVLVESVVTLLCLGLAGWKSCQQPDE
jgi:ABC-2 type transport system ATP-binding protein